MCASRGRADAPQQPQQCCHDQEGYRYPANALGDPFATLVSDVAPFVEDVFSFEP
jgi:hypothetical protein